MISITLVIAALIILLLAQFGIIKNPLIVFLVVVIIIGTSAFVLRNKLNCPFAKRCPFTICPLNKSK